MARSLYEYELEENIDYWYDGLKVDRDDFVFAITENRGHVAMVLIMRDKTIYINEDARAKLKEFWTVNYAPNMKLFVPMMAKELADGILSVTGVKVVPDKASKQMPNKPPKRAWGKPRSK